MDQYWCFARCARKGAIVAVDITKRGFTINPSKKQDFVQLDQTVPACFQQVGRVGLGLVLGQLAVGLGLGLGIGLEDRLST